MNHVVRALTPVCLGFFALLVFPSLLLSGPVEVEEPPPPPSILPTNLQSEIPEDWSRTHLEMESTLQALIEQTNAFIVEQESEVSDGMARLRSEGYLDRRTRSSIEHALDNARDTMTGMAGMTANEEMDGWSARMIAFELGIAGDNLARQADELETPPPRAADGDAEPNGDQQLESEERQRLAQTLRKMSELLHKTARTIVRNLR